MNARGPPLTSRSIRPDTIKGRAVSTRCGRDCRSLPCPQGDGVAGWVRASSRARACWTRASPPSEVWRTSPSRSSERERADAVEHACRGVGHRASRSLLDERRIAFVWTPSSDTKPRIPSRRLRLSAISENTRETVSCTMSHIAIHMEFCRIVTRS